MASNRPPIVSLIIVVFCVAETLAVCDFQKTCSNIDISGNELEANCKSTSGSSTRSTLDLNSCIGNNDGNLVCGAGFANSCSSIQYQSSTTMSATCKKKNGQGQYTTLTFSNCVSNNNGALQCCGK